MYKNQLQELAQRSCFNLPSYTCFREGPDHAPRFKAAVNFNGETFESPSHCFTLRQAEHSAAEVALNALACRGPSNSLAARILDETGVYKNLLQEVSQRVGASLPVYTTFRTGLGHLPVFTGTVELAGVIFTGEQAKNKKQAEKNAAMAAWLSLKSLVQQFGPSISEKTHKDEQEHVTAARALQEYIRKARLSRLPFPIKFPTIHPRPSLSQQTPPTTSKILPFICPKTTPRNNRPITPINSNPTFQKPFIKTPQNQPGISFSNEIQSLVESLRARTSNFPAPGAPPYIPVRHCNPYQHHHRVAPPVTIRNTVPVFSAPPMQGTRPLASGTTPPPVTVRPVAVRMDGLPIVPSAIKVEESRFSRPLVGSRLEEIPPFAKVPSVRVERPICSKLLPFCATQASEFSAGRVDSPLSKGIVISPSPASSNEAAKETTHAGKNMLQVSTEGLKELKI